MDRKLNQKLKHFSIFLFLLSFPFFAQKKESKEINADILKKSILEKQYDSIKFLYTKNKYSEALDLGLKFRNKLEKAEENEEIKFRIYFLIGEIFRKTKNHKKAIGFYKKSLNIIKETTAFNIEKSSSFEHANEEASLRTNLFRIAGQYLILDKKDSAKIYYYKLLDLEDFGHISDQITRAGTYTNLSNIYREDTIYDKAENYSEKAISIYKRLNKKVLESAALGNLASVYLDQKKYLKAKKTYLDGIDLIRKDTSERATQYREYLFFNLAYTLYLLKDYEAYIYQEKSYEIKDNLRENSVRRALEQIYAKNKLDIQKEKANLIKYQAELEKAQKRKYNYLFAAITLLTIIISAVVIYNIRLRQRNLKLKLEQTKLVEKQKIDHLKSETQVKILNATIDGKETERKQIAETLHDSVSALLSSANMHLRATKKQFNGSTPVELEKTQDIILEASQKVRDLSHNLVSSILLKFGLEYAIKDIAKKYSNRELEFHTEISNVDRYSQEFEIKLYNVIHELINNIIKHSKASNAYIIIEERNDFLSVRIEDDGVGFDYKTSNSNSGGLGLNQIEARIQMMNGNFLVESGANQGSKITFSVPVQKRSQTSFV